MANNDDEKQVDMVLNSIKKDKKSKDNNKSKSQSNKKEKKTKKKEANDSNNTPGVVIDPNEDDKNDKIYRGYYLENQNLQKLNSISEQTGKDKSQLVNMALNFFFDNLTIKRK